MSARDTGGPAFPREDYQLNGAGGQEGISARDYFAAKAMQAAITGHISYYGHDNYWNPKDIASYALEVADAMLAERAKEPA